MPKNKRTMAALVGLVVAGLATAGWSADGGHWQAIEQALGRKGEVKDGVYKATFPRTDLKVRVGNVELARGIKIDDVAGLDAAGIDRFRDPCCATKAPPR